MKLIHNLQYFYSLSGFKMLQKKIKLFPVGIEYTIHHHWVRGNTGEEILKLRKQRLAEELVLARNTDKFKTNYYLGKMKG